MVKEIQLLIHLINSFLLALTLILGNILWLVFLRSYWGLSLVTLHWCLLSRGSWYPLSRRSWLIERLIWPELPILTLLSRIVLVIIPLVLDRLLVKVKVLSLVKIRLPWSKIWSWLPSKILLVPWSIILLKIRIVISSWSKWSEFSWLYFLVRLYLHIVEIPVYLFKSLLIELFVLLHDILDISRFFNDHSFFHLFVSEIQILNFCRRGDSSCQNNGFNFLSDLGYILCLCNSYVSFFKKFY